MKIKSLCWTIALMGASLPFMTPAHAQNAVTPGIGGRLSVVELKDTTLADALEMVFQAAGNPSHIIDEQAQMVPIQAYSLTNIAWDAAVRNLAQLNGYKVSRNPSGTYLIEPRVIPSFDGSSFPGSSGFDRTSGSSSSSSGSSSSFQGGPPNPFLRNRGSGSTNMRSNGSLRTSANSQTRPNIGGRGGGTALDPNEGKDYKIIIVRHIYAGGLAQLFGNSSVIRTQDFVSPGQSGGGSSGGGGGRSGIGGGVGGGGGGGGIGGIGGGGSGGGGGGFGGGVGF